MKRIDDIKEYLHGNRKGKAANHMEREALSDPFLYEALEGLMARGRFSPTIRAARQISSGVSPVISAVFSGVNCST